MREWTDSQKCTEVRERVGVQGEEGGLTNSVFVLFLFLGHHLLAS
jgi:hypothetical protein